MRRGGRGALHCPISVPQRERGQDPYGFHTAAVTILTGRSCLRVPIPHNSDVADGVEDLLGAARARLAEATIPRERLGEIVRPRVLAGLRAPKVVPRGAVWRVGVLLLGDRDVYAAGNVVRAGDPGRRGFASDAARARAEVAAAATRGGFADGETVHLDWTVLDLSALARGGTTGPLALVSGTPSIRWSPTAGLVPLAGYLDERLALIVNPPQGA